MSVERLLFDIVKRNLREFQHCELIQMNDYFSFPFSPIINYCPVTSGDTRFCDMKED